MNTQFISPLGWSYFTANMIVPQTPLLHSIPFQLGVGLFIDQNNYFGSLMTYGEWCGDNNNLWVVSANHVTNGTFDLETVCKTVMPVNPGEVLSIKYTTIKGSLSQTITNSVGKSVYYTISSPLRTIMEIFSFPVLNNTNLTPGWNINNIVLTGTADSGTNYCKEIDTVNTVCSTKTITSSLSNCYIQDCKVNGGENTTKTFNTTNTINSRNSTNTINPSNTINITNPTNETNSINSVLPNLFVIFFIYLLFI